MPNWLNCVRYLVCNRGFVLMKCPLNERPPYHCSVDAR